jgi:hypothetical protein
MTKTYQFETEHFRFSEDEIQLLRSRYPYKRVNFNEIAKISILRSIRVKHPILVLTFGLTLILVSLYFLLYSSGFIDNILNNRVEPGESIRDFKTFGYLLIMFGFVIAIGGISVYQATFRTWVLRTEFNDGTYDVFALNKLFDTNELFKLARYLRTNFRSDQLEIDNRIA